MMPYWWIGDLAVSSSGVLNVDYGQKFSAAYQESSQESSYRHAGWRGDRVLQAGSIERCTNDRTLEYNKTPFLTPPLHCPLWREFVSIRLHVNLQLIDSQPS